MTIDELVNIPNKLDDIENCLMALRCRVDALESRLSAPEAAEESAAPEDKGSGDKGIEINCRPPCPECFVCNGHNSSCSQYKEPPAVQEPKRWYGNIYLDNPARATIHDSERVADIRVLEGRDFQRREFVEASAYDAVVKERDAIKKEHDLLQAERDVLVEQLTGIISRSSGWFYTRPLSDILERAAAARRGK